MTDFIQTVLRFWTRQPKDMLIYKISWALHSGFEGHVHIKNTNK